MSTETEGSFDVGGATLYTKTWTPDGPIRAKLIFVHGFGDHIGRYYGLFPALAARGIQVFGWDQRGWGRSVKKPAERGLTGPTSRVIADMAAFIKDKLPSDVPVFVMGNSMGGGQVLILASDPQYDDLISQVHGWLLESPFIAFPPGEQPSFLKVFFGKLLGRVLPHQLLHSAIPPEYFSRDPEVVQNYKDDPLCHEYGTLEGLSGMLERTDNLRNGKVKLSSKVKRLFMAHGNADRTTSFAASKEWFDAQTIEDAKYKTFEGCYHQLHSDFCKEEFYNDVGDWILERAQVKDTEPDSKVEPKL